MSGWRISNKSRQRPALAAQSSPLTSGNDRVDYFMNTSFDRITGMSSALSAYVAGAIMTEQNQSGMYGHVAEIGAFEGRFLIPLLFGLRSAEYGIAIDTFDWPDSDVRTRLEKNLRDAGVGQCVSIVHANSRDIRAADLLSSQGGMKLRFIHVDGDHQACSLRADLDLSLELMEPWGVVCLDDMLNPAYPRLAVVVDEFLSKNPNLAVFCITDRESLSAATKYFIARREITEFYEERLVARFSNCIWPMRGDFSDYSSLVLSQVPRIKRFLPGGAVVDYPQ